MLTLCAQLFELLFFGGRDFRDLSASLFFFSFTLLLHFVSLLLDGRTLPPLPPLSPRPPASTSVRLCSLAGPAVRLRQCRRVFFMARRRAAAAAASSGAHDRRPDLGRRVTHNAWGAGRGGGADGVWGAA